MKSMTNSAKARRVSAARADALAASNNFARAAANALRDAAQALDVLAASGAKDPMRVIQSVHAVMAGPLVGGLMVDAQDLANPL